MTAKWANARNWGAPGILVIDDDPTVRRMLEVTLRGCGYGVQLAEDGPHGIELFSREREHISLVLLDCEMPGMNGDQVFDRLRAIDPEVKVVVSSGRALREITQMFTGRAVAKFLPKPFTPRKLDETIRSVLAA